MKTKQQTKKKKKGRGARVSSRQTDRFIFPFTEAGKTRLVDPLAVHRRLVTQEGFDLETELKLGLSSTPLSAAALGNVCQAVRTAFQLLPFEEGGLTDAECLSLLISFGNWIETVKKKLPPQQTSPPPSVPPESGAS